MGKKKKSAENELKASVHKIWLAGLGALSAAGEGGSKLFQSLAEKGKELEKGPGLADRGRKFAQHHRSRQKC